MYFYRTNAGAEIDLVLLPPGKPPVGIEIKYTKTPALSKGFKQAFTDLGCRKGFIVCPVEERFPLTKNVDAVPVDEISF